MSDIKPLSAGPTLDAIVAEKVMHWHHHHGLDQPKKYPAFVIDTTGVRVARLAGRIVHFELWAPSTRIADAFEVIETGSGLTDPDGMDRWYFSVAQTPLGYRVYLSHRTDTGETDAQDHVDAETAALAICRAALKVIANQ